MVLIPEFSVTPVVKGKDAVRFLERMKNPKPLSAERRAELARIRELLDRQQAEDEVTARPATV